MISDEPAGTVDATATFERGQPYHTTEGETGIGEPLPGDAVTLTLVIQGPGAPAELGCTLFQVRHKLHTPNPSG